jgi:hypothetical protein
MAGTFIIRRLTAIAVAWVNVERSGTDDGKTNTFQVLITNGSIGGTEGANFCYCYNDMQWTTRGPTGFGDPAAFVGAIKGVSSVYFSHFVLAFVGMDGLTLTIVSPYYCWLTSKGWKQYFPTRIF